LYDNVTRVEGFGMEVVGCVGGLGWYGYVGAEVRVSEMLDVVYNVTGFVEGIVWVGVCGEVMMQSGSITFFQKRKLRILIFHALRN
jgi:hypothetical protein